MFQAGVALAIAGVVWSVWPQGDPAFASRPWAVWHSTYRHGPAVMIDRGHWNRSGADPRFDGLAQILVFDGYQVSRNRQEFVPDLFRGTWVLVVEDALGWKGALRPAGLNLRADAFAPDEVSAVRDWVYRGGSLLLVADRPPACEASQSLAGAFGVRLADTPAGPAHFAIDGDFGDGVRFATSLGGGKVAGPPGSLPFLQAQGTALEFGRGRVAVLTALLAGTHTQDNRQLMLNVMHWLSRAE